MIGAGFGGLGAAHALREAGVTDVTILERADAVGGVWRDNTYPGAACDVPSPLYSWSWATNPRLVAPLLRRSPRSSTTSSAPPTPTGLLDLVRTGTTVTGLTWDGSWRVATTTGTYDADLVVAAVGQLSEPVVPAIPGADTFAGPAFHSAEWRHDVDLRGKRVAVIGTGASAVQLVPGIVDEVGAMTVFQRSAPYVVLRPDRLYSRLHHRLFRRFPAVLAAERRATYELTELFNRALEGTSRVKRPLMAAIRGGLAAAPAPPGQGPGAAPAAGARLPARLQAAALLQRLVPRPRPRPRRRRRPSACSGIEPAGVRTADGRLHEADVLIWGTGFAATDFLGRIDVRGVDGVALRDVWADGARAHLGLTRARLPQPVLRLRPQHQPRRQLDHPDARGPGRLDRPGRAPDRGRRRPAPSPYAVRSGRPTTRRCSRGSASGIWSRCDSWYRDGGRITTNWPGQVAEYQRRLATVDWADLEEVG